MGVIRFFKNMYSVFFGNNEELKEEEVVVRSEFSKQEIETINKTELNEEQFLEDDSERHRFCVLGEFAEEDFFTNKVSELSKFTSIPLSTVYRLLNKAEKLEEDVIAYKGYTILINTEYQDEIA